MSIWVRVGPREHVYAYRSGDGRPVKDQLARYIITRLNCQLVECTLELSDLGCHHHVSSSSDVSSLARRE